MPARRAPLFTSRVGRRVFVLFLSCVLLPVLALGYAILESGWSRLREEATTHLRDTAKAHGMAIVERLGLADVELAALATHRPEEMAQRDLGTWDSRFHGIGLRASGQPERAIFGQFEPPPPLTAAQREHLDGGNPLLVETTSDAGTPMVYLIRRTGPDPTRGAELWARLRLDHLVDPRRVSSPHVLTAMDAGGAIVTTTGPEIDAAAAKRLLVALQRADGGLATREEGTEHSVAVAWRVFFRARYGASPWYAVVSMPEAEFLRSVNRFRYDLIGVVGLVLFGVVLLSMIQIRGTLRPIAILKAATRDIAAQEFDRPVHLTSGDEFEELGHSLNRMAASLGRQFRLLDAIAAINRTVIVSLDRSAIIDQVIRRLPAVAGCEVAAVALLDHREGTTQVTLRACDGWEYTRVERSDDVSLESIHALGESELRAPDELPGFLAQLRDRGLARVLLVPLRQDARTVGLLACGYDRDLVPGPETRDDIRNIANQLLVGIANANLVAGLERMNWGTLAALARAIDAKSKWTSGHSERVMRLASALAEGIGLAADRTENLRRAALLHDVGKIGTPVSILDKPTDLTAEEKRVMDEHVDLGCEILAPIEAFRDSVPIVRQHHEKMDGSGYPRGLKGEEICLEARILAVADCFDAMRSPRPYRDGIPREAVISYMKGLAGQALDPMIVSMLGRVLADEPELDPHPEGTGARRARSAQ